MVHARDIKEIVGMLMKAVGGGEVSPDEVMDLAFEADDDLQDVVNEAYIKLLEFAHDREARRNDPQLDRKMRARLKARLVNIDRAAD